jgi:hypothetical protein
MDISDLTFKEKQHIRYATIGGRLTVAAFKANREAQKRLDPNKEVCWECRAIAIKLGIEAAANAK